MREIFTYGSVGGGGGNPASYPEAGTLIEDSLGPVFVLAVSVLIGGVISPACGEAPSVIP
jgi:hypothetical protein